MNEMGYGKGLMTDDGLRCYELYQKLQYLMMNIFILPLLISYFIQPPFVLESVTEYASHCMRLHMERSVYNIGN
jgi:hypothetical protein